MFSIQPDWAPAVSAATLRTLQRKAAWHTNECSTFQILGLQRTLRNITSFPSPSPWFIPLFLVYHIKSKILNLVVIHQTVKGVRGIHLFPMFYEFLFISKLVTGRTYFLSKQPSGFQTRGHNTNSGHFAANAGQYGCEVLSSGDLESINSVSSNLQATLKTAGRNRGTWFLSTSLLWGRCVWTTRTSSLLWATRSADYQP